MLGARVLGLEGRHMSKKKGTSPTEGWGEWSRKVGSLSAPSVVVPEVKDSWETIVLRDFRMGNVEFDTTGRVVVGAMASALHGMPAFMAETLNMLRLREVLLLSAQEAESIRGHLEAGLLVLSPEGRPEAVAGGTNEPAARVLAGYLDLALEAYARQVGQPRLVDLPAIYELLGSGDLLPIP